MGDGQAIAQYMFQFIIRKQEDKRRSFDVTIMIQMMKRKTKYVNVRVKSCRVITSCCKKLMDYYHSVILSPLDDFWINYVFTEIRARKFVYR